jgi:hypothetical protein
MPLTQTADVVRFVIPSALRRVGSVGQSDSLRRPLARENLQLTILPDYGTKPRVSPRGVIVLDIPGVDGCADRRAKWLSFAARRGFWLEQLAVADLLLRPTRVMSCTGDPIVPAINEKILATLIPECML